MEEKNKMALMPVRKLLYSMAVPLMMSLLIQSLYNIVDSMFVARLSEDALTATSLVYSIQFLMIAIGVGTSVGLNALLSRKVGEKKVEEACRIATTGLLLMIMTALFFSLIGVLFSKNLSMLLANDPVLQGLCEDYLSISLIFGWGIFIQTYGQRLLQAVGDTFLSMVSLVVGAVLNVILDPIMIFGLLGCPALGIKGAAIASVIGQLAASATALILNRMKNPVIHVRFRGYCFDWQDVVNIYRVGLPTIIMQAMGSVMMLSMNAILINVSATAVAFFGVYYKLQNFLMMPMNGLGQAAIPVVGYNYGTGNKARIQQTWQVLIPTAVVFALLGMVIFMVFPRQLLSLFAASEAMIAMGVPALRIVSVTFVFATVTMMSGYFASGLGNGVINMIGTALRQLVLLVPCAYVLIQYAGLPWAWFAFWISEAVAFGYSYFAARRLLEMKIFIHSNNVD